MAEAQSGNVECRLVMVGAFPPPVHGMSAVNAAMLRELTAADNRPHVLDIAAPTLDRRLRFRLQRVFRCVRGWMWMLLGRRRCRATLYMSVSGGFGQIYEIVFLLLARMRGMRVFLHHHCYAYLGAHPKWCTHILMWVAGNNATHVALCACMKDRLSHLYPTMATYVALSNAWLVERVEDRRGHGGAELCTVGFLSNISVDKGIFIFLDVMEAMDATQFRLRGKIAGPFEDVKTEAAVRARLADLPEVEYVGPQYGADKDIFYKSVDVLLFPTQYENEAEPVTIHEATAHGLPVIAYARGCIGNMITSETGAVIDSGDDFVGAATAKLMKWCSEPKSFREAAAAAVDLFDKNRMKARDQLQVLINSMGDV